MTIEKHDPLKEEFMNVLENLRPDLCFPSDWSEAQVELANREVTPTRTKSGLLSVIPATCSAEKCPYRARCPLFKQGQAPKHKPCPYEMALVRNLFEDFCEELAVDMNRMVEVCIVRDMVNQEVQQWRASNILGLEHFIQDNVIGIDKEGNVVTKKELHMAVELEDRLHRRRQKLREQLMATREKQAQAGIHQVDTARALADIYDRVQDYERKRDRELLKFKGDTYISEHDIVDAESEEEDD